MILNGYKKVICVDMKHIVCVFSTHHMEGLGVVSAPSREEQGVVFTGDSYSGSFCILTVNATYIAGEMTRLPVSKCDAAKDAMKYYSPYQMKA